MRREVRNSATRWEVGEMGGFFFDEAPTLPVRRGLRPRFGVKSTK